jgi:endonuclease YncB( thermonuclease family)
VEGRVIGISDGDTITMLDSEKKQHKIRIAGIDAPEKGQAFSERSRQNPAQRNTSRG